MDIGKKYFTESLFVADYMASGAGSMVGGPRLYYQIGRYYFDIERKDFVKHDPYASQATYGSVGSRICNLKPLIFYMEQNEIYRLITDKSALEILAQGREQKPKFLIEKLFVADYMASGAGSMVGGPRLYYQIGDYFFDVETNMAVEDDPYVSHATYGSIGARIDNIIPFVHFLTSDQLQPILTKEEVLDIFKNKGTKGREFTK